MLEKAAVAVKADKTKTLDTINKGEGGFLDRDLYVFCFNSGDGKIVATGSTNPAAKKTIGSGCQDPKGCRRQDVWSGTLRRGEGRSNH